MSASWRKPKARADHTDDWLMTYADLITLLLCFFAIIVITSIPKKDMRPKIPVAPVAAAQPEQPPPLPPPPPAAVAPPTLPPAPLAIFPGDLPFHNIAEEDTESDPAPVPRAAAEDVKATAAVETPPAPVAAPPALVETPPQPAAPVNAPPSGDRITSIEINSAAFFASGSATLSKGGAAILLNVAAKLKSDAFRDYQITVEGHTDDTPVHTLQFPSNWELSTARASAVVHFFLEQGIPAPRLRAAGYADTFPKAPNRDASGAPIPANQAENRRVVIKLEKIEKK